MAQTVIRAVKGFADESTLFTDKHPFCHIIKLVRAREIDLYQEMGGGFAFYWKKIRQFVNYS